jgi:hypothetical protein
MIKNYFLLGSLLCSMGAFSQSTVWKHTGWEARISDKGYLEQIIFKDKKGNDTIPFFRSGQGNCGLFMLKSVAKKLPQLGYLTDIFLIGAR